VGRDVRQARDGIDDRFAGRELWPASQTGAESRAFRGGGRLEETTSFGIRDARGADRTAVDARRRDADEEQSIESRVARA
jgi:hypothetical protein